MNYELISPRSTKTAIEQILINRGLPPTEIEHYLSTRDSDILDPKLLNNIEQGAKMLVKHIG